MGAEGFASGFVSRVSRSKRPTASAVQTQHVVLPPDTNVHGTAFGGRIMQWMDIAAGIAAGRHAQGPVVTVAVDDLHFARPIKMGDVVTIRAMVNFTGTTSMEVGVRVDRETVQDARREHCLSGYFTFVAVDAQGQPKTVSGVLPASIVARRRFRAAQERRQRRLRGRGTGTKGER